MDNKDKKEDRLSRFDQKFVAQKDSFSIGSYDPNRPKGTELIDEKIKFLKKEKDIYDKLKADEITQEEYDILYQQIQDEKPYYI